jgi:tetratricopeptide (TPR) repeat protein
MVEGRLDDAVAFLREAIRRQPTGTATYRDVAHLHLLRGETAPAVAALTEAARLRPQEIETHGMLVSAYIQVGDADGAIAEQRTVAEMSHAPEARRKLATFLLAAGDFDAGVAELRSLVAEAPLFAAGQATLGRALEAAGRHVEAKPFLEEAARLEPGILDRLPAVDSRPSPPK